MNYINIAIKNKELKHELKMQAVREKTTIIELIERIMYDYLQGAK